MKDDHAIDHIHLDEGVVESREEYIKLASVFVGILTVTLFLAWARGFQVERFMSDFMAVFFITFAAFKFFNLEDFVSAYRSYDIVAKRLSLWAYGYPFLEGILGVSYLLLDQSNILNIFTVILMGVGLVGVIKELRNQSNIMCACLGTIIRLPLSKVSLIENASMLAIAVFMFLLS